MKIGMFSDSYRPYTSGVVRSIETTAAKLTELGHEVFIFAPRYPKYTREAGVFRFLSVPAPTNPDYAVALPFSLNISATVRRLGLDVIHVHSPFSMGMLGAWSARRGKLPLVFTYHTMYDQYVHYVPIARGVSKKVVVRLSSNFCNRCDLVITPTEVIRAIVSKNVKTRVKAIPTGIDTGEFTGADRLWLRREYRVAADESILLYLGRLGKEKNVEFLLESFADILKEKPKTKFIIAGDGPEKEALEKKAKKLGFGDRALFTGALTRENVIKCYAGADLFIFASTTETQGLVLGEAKAAGLPAVAVRALGAAEMVKDGVDGFLTDLNLQQFNRRVLQLLNDGTLRGNMAADAKKEAVNISTSVMAKRLVQAYDDAIQAKAAKKIKTRDSLK